MIKNLSPVVGYPGGKRRMLKNLRPYFNLDTINVYVEPFVGMGAVYLDLRNRGYMGQAILADNNLMVAEYWRALHDRIAGPALVEAADRIKSWAATEDGFWKMMADKVYDKTEQIARFLWLTNFMYANLPPSLVDDSWIAPRSSGTKLKSATKWNKTFPWGPCVERLSCIQKVLSGLPCEIFDDGLNVLAELSGHETIYADPPYVGRAQYKGNGRFNSDNFMSYVFSAKGNIVLSEMTYIEPPVGWNVQAVSLLSRQAGPFNGAGPQRQELIYSNFKPPLNPAI